MALIDLYELLLQMQYEQPIYVIFTRVYSKGWQRCLRIRPQILQSKCDDCERFKLLRLQATTHEQAVAVRPPRPLPVQ